MKLASTYQRFYFVLLCILLAAGCLAYYLSIRYVLIHQVDNDLKIEQQELLDFVRLHDSLPAPSHYRDQRLEWVALPGSTPGTDKRRFVNGYDPDKHDPIREEIFTLWVHDKHYLVTISKS